MTTSSWSDVYPRLQRNVAQSSCTLVHAFSNTARW